MPFTDIQCPECDEFLIKDDHCLDGYYCCECEKHFAFVCWSGESCDSLLTEYEPYCGYEGSYLSLEMLTKEEEEFLNERT